MLGPITAIDLSVFERGNVWFLFFSSTIDSRAASSASCRCFSESFAENGMLEWGATPGGSNIPRRKRASKSRLSARSISAPLSIAMASSSGEMPSRLTIATWNVKWFFDNYRGDNSSDAAKANSAASREAWDTKRAAVAEVIAKINPTIVALQALYPKLSPGGYLIVDDYGAVPGCRRAVDDYREQEGITEPIEVVDWGGVFWRKG